MNIFSLKAYGFHIESARPSSIALMHYLNYLAVKLAAEFNNQSHLLNFAPPGPGSDHGDTAESIRMVLEEEVAAGRLRYNALSCDLDAVVEQEGADPCFPEWTENQS